MTKDIRHFSSNTDMVRSPTCALTATLVGLFFVGGCKEVSIKDLQRFDRQDRSSIGQPAGEKVGSERLADASAEINGEKEFYANLWQKDFTVKLTDLPASGTVPADKIPYSGFWYPQKTGGTNLRLKQGDPSPLEKYDKAFNGGTTKAASWEKEKHTVAASDPSAGWAGHCNGFSAAAQRHARPKHSVTKGGTTFEIHDIKALLAEIHMSAKYLFLGGRRCENQGTLPSPGSRANPAEMGECEDINPGTFHVAIANWIGKARHTLVFDISVGYQVWNYPLYAYSSTITTITKADALQRITGNAGGVYKFNPNAVKFAYVQTTATYAEALGYEPIGDAGPTSQPQSKTYYYVLEQNEKDEVVGGEWVSTSQTDHPDFVWVAFEPVIGNGSGFFGNPNVDPEQVVRLWAESIDADPNNPPLDIKEPASINDWGRFANFDLTLDGTTTGAVFAGKKIRLAVARRGEVAGAVTLEISVDGAVANTLQLDGTGPAIFDFNPPPGLHRLDLTWKKGTTQVDKQTTGFHVIP